jgi:hypothetical protein
MSKLVKIVTMPYIRSSRSGQTAVFVFILLLVGLTIGISLSSRTIVDLKGSSTSDLSSRAFSAAEAGVEEALRQDLNSISDGSAHPGAFAANQSNFSYTVTKSTSFVQTIQRDNAVQVGLSDASGNPYAGGVLTIYWVKTTDAVENANGNRPSLELTLVKNNSGTYSIKKYAVNAEVKGNNLTEPGSADGAAVNSAGNYSGISVFDSGSYTNLVTLRLVASDKAVALRIRALYNKASVYLIHNSITDTDGSNLPTQSYVIKSQGVAGTSTRVVQVVRTIPALPALFDYVLFNGSTNSLSK